MEVGLPFYLLHVLQCFFSLVNKQTETFSHQELVGFKGGCSIFWLLLKKKKMFAIIYSISCSYLLIHIHSLHFLLLHCLTSQVFVASVLQVSNPFLWSHVTSNTHTMNLGAKGSFCSLLMLIKIIFANKHSTFPKNWNEEKHSNNIYLYLNIFILKYIYI